MWKLARIAIILALICAALPVRGVSAAPTVYYVSSTDGSDSNSGADQAHPFRTVAKVNSLNLAPGDQVLFKCGDVWRADRLVVSHSGTSGSPIMYSSYPGGCSNQPRLDGTLPVTGWSAYSGNIYVASFSAYPVNQLFRNGRRLTMGRWPNLDAGDGGYATVESQPVGNKLSLSGLPAVNWSGATIHLKVIRWSMVNRDVTASSGSTLTLNAAVDCWYGTCKGWGFFINNSLATLDRDGEWYYDKAAKKIYLYATSNPNAATIEASVVLGDTGRNLGGVTLGTDMQAAVHYVVVDNLAIRGWYQNGISSPTNLHPDENSYLTLRNNTIQDVDDSGINLFTWVYEASDKLDGWRGGNNIFIQNNTIDGANHFGIHTPSRQTTIEGNTIRNVGLIANLNESGMGCGKSGNEGTCTEDGAGLRIYVDNPALSGTGFTVRYNLFENIGYNGIQTFGSSSTFANNIFNYTCVSKGDGGAITTFGNGSLSSSNVHDIQILNNVILYTIGNTDGTQADFRPLFGFGIYLDSFSRNITTRGNTVAFSTASGILYQNSTGLIENNILYHNANGSMWADQVSIGSSPAGLSAFNGNVMVSANNHSRNLSLSSAGQVGSADNNHYFHASSTAMQVVLNGQNLSLSQWQQASGKDAHATSGSPTVSGNILLAYNETTADKTIYTVGWTFQDLDGNPLGSSFVLPPYTSKLMVLSGSPLNPVFLPLVRR